MAVWPTVEALIVSDRSPEGVEAQMREAETAGVKYMITHSSPEALGSALAVQVELVHRAQVRQNLTPCAGAAARSAPVPCRRAVPSRERRCTTRGRSRGRRDHTNAGLGGSANAGHAVTPAGECEGPEGPSPGVWGEAPRTHSLSANRA